MKFPFVLRSRLDKAEALLSTSIADHRATLDTHKQVLAREHVKRGKVQEEAVNLRRSNSALQKILGVVCGRGAVRVAMHDLRRPTPEIRMEQEEVCRKPTLRIFAVYPSPGLVQPVNVDGENVRVLVNRDGTAADDLTG